MTFDTVIYILIGVGYIAMSVLGGLMSSENWKYKAWKYYAHTFITIAVITGILIIIQGVRNQKAQEELTGILQIIANKQFPDLAPSEALEKLKQLEIRTSTLEQKTTFRTLTLEQKTELIKILSSYKGHSITIGAVDSESRQFAEQFKEVFEKAGWIIKGNEIQSGITSPTFFGIIVGVGTPLPKNEPIIIDALRQVGLQIKVKRFTTLKTDEITLYICAKQ